MSLPPGFLDELRTRTSLAQVVGRKVTWDNRKSNQGKGDMWAPCPFHQEKTASFHVDDRKGYYYCFGCHEKGDAISFVRGTENVGFMEAVEILAREAGMQMPARDPKAQEKADRRTELAQVMEQALQFFRLQLQTGAAAPARDYLVGRGFDQAKLDRWEIGFAPDAWQGLWDHLTGKGVKDDLILAAGLGKPSTKGGKPYDTFRNRIIFPIRDPRGRCIAFGGRAMDPSDSAKYLNSPETELFDKGRSLYNHGPAREAAGKGQPLVVAEGYMDVIALSEAGFKSTVAPLGTAITEDQLRLLWRIHPEPVIALDGDTAGIRAAMRLIDLALPMLEAGQSLRFCVLPEGQDPDDLLKAQGRGAMQNLIEAAQPMVQLLWQRETEGKVFDSPERRAALDKSLREAIRRIGDASVRAHYGDEIKRLRQALFGQGQAPDRRFAPRKGRWSPPETAQPSTKNSALAKGGDADLIREAVVLATCIATPKVIETFESQLETMDFRDALHARLAEAILRAGPDAPLREKLSAELGPEPLDNLMTQRHVAISAGVRNAGDLEIARATLAEALAMLEAGRGAAREIEDAAADILDQADEGLTWRLQQAALALQNAGRSGDEDKTEYATAPNGAKLSRDEQSALDQLLDQIDFGKHGHRTP